MRLPFFGSGQKQINKIFTVNINSQNVQVIAFYLDEQNNPKIIGTGTCDLDPHAVRAGVIIDEGHVEDALREAMEKASDGVGDVVNTVIFGVSGDLATGLTTTAKSVRAQDGPITEKELSEIEATILDNAMITARNHYMESTGSEDVDLETVTSAPVYTKVNGNLVPAALDQHGSSVELALYNAFTPSYHVKTLQKLAKKVRLKILAIAPNTYALVSSLSTPIDYVLINIDSDITEVAVVFGRGIVSTKTLHLGSDHFTKEIAQKLGLTMEEAKKVRQTYVESKLSSTESDLVQKCLEDAISLWIDGIEILFQEFSGVKTFASTIVLTGPGSKLPDLIQTLSTEPWTKAIPFKAPPEFIKMSTDNLSNISDATGRAGSSEWLLTASLSNIFLQLQ
jgi:cell division ATPase FtsA